MRKILLLIVSLVVAGTSALALGLDAGCFSASSIDRSVLSLQSDYSSGDYSLGYTINANLSNVDYGMESLVIKYLEYDDGTMGIRYAPIENMSFGYGLLLNDLNTTYSQPPFLQNEQSGLRVYCDFDDFALEGFGTYSHLYGLRIKNFSIFNANFGLECLSDAGQTSAEAFGRSAYGAYMELPITDVFSLIAETAASSNGGEGNMAGASLDYDLIFAYSEINVAAVSFNDRFIPAYFTSGYDIDPVDFSSIEAPGRRRYGTMTAFNMGLLGLISLNYMNENYTDGGSANSAGLLITPWDRLSISGFVKELSFRDYRPVKGGDSNIIGGYVEYKMRSGISTSLNYRKAIDEDTIKPYETYYFRSGFNF
jgi:hypothetical protein